MDDESVYGPEFYKMAFSQAIEGGWLTDYKVIILTLKSDQVSESLGNLLAAEQDSGLNLDDAVKLLGCWDALADPEGVLSDRNVTGDQHNPLLRAITFTNTIKSSKMVEAHWQKVVDAARERTDAALHADLLPLDVQHVDGTQNSLDRQRKLGWLKTKDAENGQVCRVLSNARCLTEGVDVPALDAVLFLAPRKSQVDVVQAVGRVMRLAEDKPMGYIILPVVISPDQEPDQALDDNKTFQVVWSVLRALRSHDDRFDLEINSLDLNNTPTERIKIINGGEDNGEAKDRISQLSLDLVYKIPPGAIYARIVEKCGDRKYWPQWAADVAQIADRIRVRVTGLIRSPERITLRQDFHAFLADLQTNAESGPAGGGPGGDGGPASGHGSGVPGAVLRLRLRGQQSRLAAPLSRSGGAAGSLRGWRTKPGTWKASMRPCAAAPRPWTTPRRARRCCSNYTSVSSR